LTVKDHPKVSKTIQFDVFKVKKTSWQTCFLASYLGGGIGLNVSRKFRHTKGMKCTALNIDAWLKEWGIDKNNEGARSGTGSVNV